MNLKKLQITLVTCLGVGILLGTLVHKFAISDRQIAQRDEEIAKKNEQLRKMGEDFRILIEERDLKIEDLLKLLGIFEGDDDNYEENNNQRQAYKLTERKWLSSIDGLGISKDEDWYEIDVNSSYQRLIVDLRYSQEFGNLDLVLYDENNNIIKKATSKDNNEYINIDLPTEGKYYLKVYTASGSTSGNFYDLLWDDTAERKN